MKKISFNSYNNDKKKVKVKIKKKTFSLFTPKVRTRHPSHSPLRIGLGKFPFKSIIRMGSITDESDTVSHGGRRVEVNTIQGVKNSSSKLLMKQCFQQGGVKTADWIKGIGNNSETIINWSSDKYPVVAKHTHGSRGSGNYLLKTKEELLSWLSGKDLKTYIFEKFYTYSREYRLHIANGECFYTCRKLLKNNVPEGTWQRHDDTVSWILENNESFKKPKNWNEIVVDCIKAQKALGLDICAFDVLVQGSKEGKERTKHEWIILESCSAPSFGDVTTQKYLQEIPKILRIKYSKI